MHPTLRVHYRQENSGARLRDIRRIKAEAECGSRPDRPYGVLEKICPEARLCYLTALDMKLNGRQLGKPNHANDRTELQESFGSHRVAKSRHFPGKIGRRRPRLFTHFEDHIISWQYNAEAVDSHRDDKQAGEDKRQRKRREQVLP